ncbi:MAG: TPM domain-containing protein [Bacteroidota bacterium]
MKLFKHIFFTLFVFCCTNLFGQQNIPERPNPPKLVNDALALLTHDQQLALEQKLVAFDQRTSTQIAIVTTNDIAGMDVGDYAVELGRKWGVGNKNFNNGVVVVIYRSQDNTKRKVFIASGEGLEGVLPDYTGSEIVNNEMIPFLKGGDYYQALNNGTDAIIKATEGKYKAPEGYGKKKGLSFGKIILIIILVIVFLSIGSKGGGGGSYMSRRGHRGFNGPVIWFPGSGSSGSSGGGFGGGGGGFGGFGGGSFGGGGAGGDW